jgi:hypothetical protein
MRIKQSWVPIFAQHHDAPDSATEGFRLPEGLPSAKQVGAGADDLDSHRNEVGFQVCRGCASSRNPNLHTLVKM